MLCEYSEKIRIIFARAKVSYFRRNNMYGKFVVKIFHVTTTTKLSMLNAKEIFEHF